MDNKLNKLNEFQECLESLLKQYDFLNKSNDYKYNSLFDFLYQNYQNEPDMNMKIGLSNNSDINKNYLIGGSKTRLLVLHWTDWCGHCKIFKPEWEEIKKEVGKKINCIEVNHTFTPCTLNSKYKNILKEVSGFPTIYLYNDYHNNLNYDEEKKSELQNGNIIEYSGERNKDKILEFIEYK